MWLGFIWLRIGTSGRLFITLVLLVCGVRKLQLSVKFSLSPACEPPVMNQMDLYKTNINKLIYFLIIYRTMNMSSTIEFLLFGLIKILPLDDALNEVPRHKDVFTA